LKDKPQQYVKLFDKDNEDLLQPVNIPEAVAMFDENLNYENISISYELFNDVIIWGLVNYPDLRYFFMDQAEVHGSKISFDKDLFKPLTNDKDFMYFKDIKRGSTVYKRLTMSQKYICNLIQDYDKFAPEIKDKYTSVCKTKLFDRYGNYVVNFAITTYPGVKDIYEKEETMLLEEKLMPYGKFKGSPIADMDKKDIKDFFKTKEFKQNPKVRKVFRKSTFGELMKSESEYKDMVVPTKNKSKSMSTKGALQVKLAKYRTKNGVLRKGKTTRKGKRTLYYFYMDGCTWCDKFNPTWLKLIKEFKNKLTMKKVNGPSSPNLLKQFDIQTFPAIVLVTGTDSDKYEGDRSMKDLKQFLR
jgi:thiol-disulfide isomerase/thioredoxin